MCVSINNSGLHTEISFVFRSQSNHLKTCGVAEWKLNSLRSFRSVPATKFQAMRVFSPQRYALATVV